MKDHNSTSYFAEGHQRKIFGFPERSLYRVGVFIFYILLFFAVSIISSNLPTSQNKRPANSQIK